MPIVRIAGLLLVVWMAQTGAPSYVLRGDQVERQFRLHTEQLDEFFVLLREIVTGAAPELLPELDLEDPPPEPGVYGYQLLPPIVDELDAASRESVSTFSYSWLITQRYIEGETRKLGAARSDLLELRASDGTITLNVLEESIDGYRTLVDNLETIDQYLQYNRFWQRAIAEDRSRFDRLTELYEMLASDTPDANEALGEFLGQPEVPSYVDTDRSETGRTVLRLPVYTDIGDEAFLDEVEAGVERMWFVGDDDSGFALDIEFRRLSPAMVYATERTPERGDHIELSEHAARFPDDGAVLTTGAESTYGFVGAYVALGPGAITLRTLAHEFGHALGFADGYVRGYRDLGEQGFEILELTSAFDDIMSAPREGRVLPSHFEVMIEAIDAR
jgi:hypothetical protein